MQCHAVYLYLETVLHVSGGFENFEGTYRNKNEGGSFPRNVGIDNPDTHSSNSEKLNPRQD
jgi:hypothetical protein